MSEKNYDGYHRFRSRTIGFRLSPEESDELDRLVRLSGYTKQDYILKRLQDKNVVVQGNPKVYIALKNELGNVLSELRRIESGSEITPELTETIAFIASIIDGMRNPS